MRKVAVIFLALGAFALAACSDDTEPGKLDTKVTKKDGKVATSDGTLEPDLSVTPKLDTTVTGKEAGTGVCPAPLKATANSGKPCATPAECPTGEVCVGLSATATKGMCLGKCCPNEADPTDPINLCPVADTAKQLSACELQLIDPTTKQPTGQGACVWACEITASGQTKTFDCPNATDYNCVAIFTNAPEVKYCVPK